MIQKLFKHINKVMIHKYFVFKYSLKLRIPLQGILHDLSKFSFGELRESVLYYTGDKSPIPSARDAIGYSKCWMYHIHRNNHHSEYWVDFKDNDKLIPVPMPNHKIKEMICDKLAAYIAYNPNNWDYSSPLNYYMEIREGEMIHPDTEIKLIHCLTLLSEKKEMGFDEINRYLK